MANIAEDATFHCLTLSGENILHLLQFKWGEQDYRSPTSNLPLSLSFLFDYS